jgi:hypothetical protein
VCATVVQDERATKSRRLLELVTEVSNTLVDLGTLPIQNIPQLPKMTQEVLAVVGLILERLREEHASSAGPWE